MEDTVSIWIEDQLVGENLMLNTLQHPTSTGTRISLFKKSDSTYTCELFYFNTLSKESQTLYKELPLSELILKNQIELTLKIKEKRVKSIIPIEQKYIMVIRVPFDYVDNSRYPKIKFEYFRKLPQYR